MCTCGIAALVLILAMGSGNGTHGNAATSGSMIVQPLPPGQITDRTCMAVILGTSFGATCTEWRALAVDSLDVREYLVQVGLGENALQISASVRPDTLTYIVVDFPSDEVAITHIPQDSVRSWVASRYKQPSTGALDRLPFDLGPMTVSRRPPNYPELARQAELEGVVIVEISVNADGTVASSRVVQGIPGLNEAALECLRDWRFRPAELQGEPIPSRGVWPVRFTLRG
jgi:TonB family protein